MSHRQAILRALHILQEQQGPYAHGNLDPKHILGRPADVHYQHALNLLLEEGLVLRGPAPEALGFRLNPEKKALYDSELQKWYEKPVLQWSIGTVLTIVGLVAAFMALK